MPQRDDGATPGDSQQIPRSTRPTGAPNKPSGAVVTRKMCGGGNRTRRGADSQHALASVLRTADQPGLDATDILVTLLTARTPSVPEILQTAPTVH